MSAGAIVALIVGLFFVIGVTVGVIAVIALSAVRDERRVAGRGTWPLSRPHDPAVLDEPDDDGAEYRPGVYGVPGHWDGAIPGTTAGDERPQRPRWPGDTESGFLGR